MTPVEREVRLTAACLRALAAGRKSQMRSVVKPVDGEAPDATAVCPLGSPGDQLRAEDGVLLRITRVRAERLQEIDEQDLDHEGGMWRETAVPGREESERDGFARWWDQVHSHPEAKWKENPWVWVIDFERG